LGSRALLMLRGRLRLPLRLLLLLGLLLLRALRGSRLRTLRLCGLDSAILLFRALGAALLLTAGAEGADAFGAEAEVGFAGWQGGDVLHPLQPCPERRKSCDFTRECE